MTHPRITFIGAGNMATSLIGGLLAQGIPASHIRASDPGAEQRAKVAAEFGIELFESNAEAIAGVDVVVEKPLTRMTGTCEPLCLSHSQSCRPLNSGMLKSMIIKSGRLALLFQRSCNSRPLVMNST